MTSGLRQIRQQFGPDALILSTRTRKSEKPGLPGKSMIEITAAIDPAESGTAAPTPRSTLRTGVGRHSPYSPSPPPQTGTHVNRVVDDDLSDLLAMAPEPHRPHRKAPTGPAADSTPALNPAERRALHTTAGSSSPPAAPPPAMVTTTALHSEIRKLHTIINGLTTRVGELTAIGSAEDHRQPQSDSLQCRLTDCGINADTAETIAGFLDSSHSEAELADDAVVTAALVETIEDLVPTATPQFRRGSHQRIAFIGPTGVGKTTTLAKICANAMTVHSDSIALITIDTYRIAAVEQLRVYADIMNLPVDVVFTADQLAEALAKHRDKELVLIDTAGRSPRDRAHIKELEEILRPEFAIERHLVLSAATREQELLATLERFAPLAPTRTVFTKLDECFTLGVLLNIQLQNAAPLSWLTNGQRVPEDLLQITAKRVAECIVNTTCPAETPFGNRN